MAKIKLSYSALSDSIESQLNQYGYTLKDKVDLIDKLQFSANMLYLHNMITGTMYDNIIKKINKKVISIITEGEKE